MKCNIKAWALFLMSAFISLSAVSANTAVESMREVVNKFKTSKGSIIEFSFQSQQGIENGKIYMKGDKFAFISQSFTNIYDGKDIWSASASTREVNISTPEDYEIAEINPVAILDTALKDYKLSSLKGPASEKRVLLNPISNDSPFKKIIVSINTSTKLPTKMTLTLHDGSEAIFTINSVKFNQNIPASQFVFNKKDFNNYKIIDLR